MNDVIRVDELNGAHHQTRLHPKTLIPYQAVNTIDKFLVALIRKRTGNRKDADPRVIRNEAAKLCVKLLRGNIIIDKK